LSPSASRPVPSGLVSTARSLDGDDADRRRRRRGDAAATAPTVDVDANGDDPVDDDDDDAVAANARGMETNDVRGRGAISVADAVPVTDRGHVQRRSSGDERGARADREPDGEREVTRAVVRRVGVVGGGVDGWGG